MVLPSISRTPPLAIVVSESRSRHGEGRHLPRLAPVSSPGLTSTYFAAVAPVQRPILPCRSGPRAAACRPVLTSLPRRSRVPIAARQDISPRILLVPRHLRRQTPTP